MLKGMGLTEEQADTIIEAHTEVADGLKADLSKYKADAEKLDGVQRELDALKAQGDDGYKEKFEKEHKAFEDYKAGIAAEKTKQAKENAYADLCREVKISDKRISSIVKLADLDKIELDDSGKIKDADKLAEALKSEWSDFIITEQTGGANVTHPPANNPSKVYNMADLKGLSAAEINKNWDSIKASLNQKG